MFRIALVDTVVILILIIDENINFSRLSFSILPMHVMQLEQFSPHLGQSLFQ